MWMLIISWSLSEISSEMKECVEVVLKRESESRWNHFYIDLLFWWDMNVKKTGENIIFLLPVDDIVGAFVVLVDGKSKYIIYLQDYLLRKLLFCWWLMIKWWTIKMLQTMGFPAHRRHGRGPCPEGWQGDKHRDRYLWKHLKQRRILIVWQVLGLGTPASNAGLKAGDVLLQVEVDFKGNCWSLSKE